MPEETPEERLRRFETVIDLQMKEIDRLRREVARLTEGADAISTLRSIYRDRDLPESLRAKAAIGCLPHEVPKLTPVAPPLDLVAEPIVPLAELVEQRRARQNLLCPESNLLPAGRGNSNGTDGDKD